jgi:hypothetical protein
VTLNEALAPFGSSSVSFLATDAVFRVAPGAPSIKPFVSVAQAVGAFGGDVEQAEEHATREGADRALWMLQGLDVGQDVFSVLSGLASAVRLYLAKHQGDGPKPGELDRYDQRQAEDAVAKLLGLSFAVGTLFEGTPQQQVETFLGLQGGRALVAWFVTIELALPFVDEVAGQGPEWLDSLVERVREAETEKLTAAVGAEAVARTWAVEALLRPHLDEGVAANDRRMETLVSQLQKRLPLVVEIGSELGGAFGGGIDALPIYHLLGSRLVAEACAKGVVRQQALPDIVEELEETLPEVSVAEPLVDPARDIALKPKRTFVNRMMASSTPALPEAEPEKPSPVPSPSPSPVPPKPPTPTPKSAPPAPKSVLVASKPAPPAPRPAPSAAKPIPPGPKPTPSAPKLHAAVSKPSAPAPAPAPKPAPAAPKSAAKPPPAPSRPAPPKPPAPKPKPPAPKPPAPKPAAPKPAAPKPAAPKPAAPKPAPPKPKVHKAKPPKKEGGGIGKVLAALGCLALLGCTGLFAVGGGAGLIAALTQPEQPRKIILIEDPSLKKKR